MNSGCKPSRRDRSLDKNEDIKSSSQTSEFGGSSASISRQQPRDETYDTHSSLLIEGITKSPDGLLRKCLSGFHKSGLWDCLPTPSFISTTVSTSQPGASAFPSFPSDSSQLHKLMKEEHLATRPFFVFVTVSQLNLDHSVLAPCASALDGSVPHVPMNATWICDQKGVLFSVFEKFVCSQAFVSGEDKCASVFLHQFWV